MSYDEYYDDYNDSNSDSEKSVQETVDYQDWSTIYNEELWEMWYSMLEVLEQAGLKDELFGGIDADDFFYDFCYENPPDIHPTFDLDMWRLHYLNHLKNVWRRIENYSSIFGSERKKTIDDFIYFVYRFNCVKKYYEHRYIV